MFTTQTSVWVATSSRNPAPAYNRFFSIFQIIQFFKSGWRPAVGWVCVLVLFYQFILNPITPWIVDLFGIITKPLPNLDMGTLITLLGGLLGLGGFRTFEKVKGAVK